MKNLPARVGREGGPTIAERAQAIRFFPWRRHVLFLASRSRLGNSLGVVLIGGAALDPEDERFWYECGYVLVQGYGLTETSALLSVHVSGPFRRRLGPIGKALPHQEVRLAADGEIWVRGPNVSNAESDSDGWLHTGDLATQDRRGQLWFRGRKKDIIVTPEGLNVCPDDVEAHLRACAGVRDAVVLEQPGPGGIGIHAVLLLDRGVSAEAVVGTANHALEPHQRIRSWTIWPAEDLPRTSLLKVQRDEVARTVRDQASRSAACLPSDLSPGGPDQVPSIEEIAAESDRRRRLELLARRLAHGPSGLAHPTLGDMSLEELGLGSLDVAELLNLAASDWPGSVDGLIRARNHPPVQLGGDGAVGRCRRDREAASVAAAGPPAPLVRGRSRAPPTPGDRACFDRRVGPVLGPTRNRMCSRIGAPGPPVHRSGRAAPSLAGCLRGMGCDPSALAGGHGNQPGLLRMVRA